MSRFQDAVRWIKNICKISNVYDCARPLLLVLGLLGLGATCISNTDGVYSLYNNKVSYVVMVIVGYCMPIWLGGFLIKIFTIEGVELYMRVAILIEIFTIALMLLTICLGYTMAIGSCKRLDRVFQIIHNIDSQLEVANIRVRHWLITLKVTVFVLAMVFYITLSEAHNTESRGYLVYILLAIILHLFHAWVILFLLIIHERFVCVNKLLQDNGITTTIQIVGERNSRDNYMLWRISLAQHVHEQLSEVVHLFTDSCRWMVVCLFLTPMMCIIAQAIHLFRYQTYEIYIIPLNVMTIVLLTSICQANKDQRRVLNARLRHLMAFETDRQIIQQVRQYIMYNAYCVKGPIDLQLTDVDNVLLFTIIDVIASNVLIIYSYNR